MPLGSLRQQLLFPTDCPKVWPAAAHSSSSHSPLPKQHKDQDQEQQDQQGLEASPLLAGRGIAGPPGGSSTAIKPSSVVQRSTGRHSFEPELPPSATSTPAAGTPGFHSSLAAAADGDSFAIHIRSSMDAASMDQQLQQLLVAVRLGHLLHRFPAGLDTELDWASVLSLGEQQRVALVRLLIHKPSLAFLDEATAALDPKSEAVVYGLIAQACSCFVSVGHRLQLLEWHSHVLVSGAGHWAKYTAAEFRQRLAAGLEG